MLSWIQLRYGATPLAQEFSGQMLSVTDLSEEFFLANLAGR